MEKSKVFVDLLSLSKKSYKNIHKATIGLAINTNILNIYLHTVCNAESCKIMVNP